MKKTDKDAALADLRHWWETSAKEEADLVIPKAIAYGSADLIELGRTMARVLNRPDMTQAQQIELGIFFYLVGKLGRWTAAIEEGREVSDDTIFDMAVYLKMAQRVRKTGGWPYATEQ